MSPPNDDVEKLRAWTPAACLIPWLGVPAVFVASYFLDHWIIQCAGRPSRTCGPQPLKSLAAALRELRLGEGMESIRLTYDVAARFTWHPTFVAFLVVAIGSVLACAYLIDDALEQSLPKYRERGRGWLIGGIAVGVFVIGFVGYRFFSPWILQTGVLSPILESAPGAGVEVLDQVQSVFRSFAFVGSVMVVAAAGAALLTPIRAVGHEDEGQLRIRHLTEQWRRLSFTLYAGAALLVTAVVHESALYGWADAFSKAAVASRDVQVHAYAAQLDSADADLKLIQAHLARDTATPLPGTTQNSARVDTAALRGAMRDAELRLAVMTHQVALDSAAAGTRMIELRATIARVSELAANAITRGSGLLFTILLAVTYLPAALVLMERARELSYAEVAAGEDEAARSTWRTSQGIGFSLGTQWAKVIAVLSPLLAAGGATYITSLLAK